MMPLIPALSRNMAMGLVFIHMEHFFEVRLAFTLFAFLIQFSNLSSVFPCALFAVRLQLFHTRSGKLRDRISLLTSRAFL